MKRPSLTQRILQHLATSGAGQSCADIAAAIGEMDFEKNVAALVSNLKARLLIVAPERGTYIITALGRMHLAGIREDAAGVDRVITTAKRAAAPAPASRLREARGPGMDLVVDPDGHLMVIRVDTIVRRLTLTASAEIASLVLALQKDAT